MCTNQLHYRKRLPQAETGIKDGFEEMEHEIRLSETTRKVVFHLLFIHFIFQKLLLMMNNHRGLFLSSTPLLCF